MSNDRPVINCEDHLEYSKAYKWLLRCSKLNPSEKLVYMRLRNCTFKFGEYQVSHDFLAHECCLAKRTIIRSLEKLEEVGLISKTRHGKKMFNSYECHIHEWMNDQNKYKNEVTDCHITKSEVTSSVKMKCQDGTSIYKEQYKKQIPQKLDRWSEYAQPFDNRSRTSDSVKKINKLTEDRYKQLLSQRSDYIKTVNQKRKKWAECPMKTALTFSNPKYWDGATWEIDQNVSLDDDNWIYQ